MYLRETLRVCREVRQVAASAAVHKCACRLKQTLLPPYWVCCGIFGGFTLGLECRHFTELGITLTQQKKQSRTSLCV